MRNVVMMAVSAILGVLSLIIVMSLAGRSNRSMELKSNLSSAVEETVEKMMQNQSYNIEDVNQFIADMVENLAVVLDSDSALRVSILQIDREKGILCTKVTEEFKHPNGKTGKVQTEKTVILNGKEEAEKVQQYAVSFYFSKDDLDHERCCYKRYLVDAGKSVTAPKDPSEDEKMFVGWKDENDYLADFSAPVEQDVTYYAAWN